MIYFIRSETGAIKIGFSTTPERRLSAMQTGSPVRLELLAVMPGTKQDERRLHARFKAQRGRGEWFSPSPDLEDLIASCGWADSKAAEVPLPHDRAGFSWRIEFNHRDTKAGSLRHWVYRFGSGKERRAIYGGMVQEWMLR